MDNKEIKDITEEYNELKKYNKIIRDEERNEKKRIRRNFFILKIIIFIVIFLLILIFIIYPIGRQIEKYRKENLTFNVMEQLKFKYKGTFEILSPDVDLTSTVTPNTLYMVKNQNGIIFNVYKNGSSISTDYDQYLYRIYLMDYITNAQTNEVKYEEKKRDFSGGTFYLIQIGVVIPSYDDIDLMVENRVKNLIQYIENRSKEDFNNETANFKLLIYLHDFIGEISYSEYRTYGLNCLINKIKVNYINYLIDNSLIDKDVSEEDINKYHRPEELKLYVNSILSSYNASGKVYPYTAVFDYNEMDYYVDINLIIDYLNEVGNKKYKLGDLHSFVYNKKEYIIDESLRYEIWKNKVPIFWTSNMLKNFFDCKIEYDFDNKTINIIK